MPSHHLPLPSALVITPSYGTPARGPVLVALIPDRQEFVPRSVRCAMITHAKSQSVRSRRLRPSAHDVPLGTYINGIPRLVFGIPAIEIVVVVGQRDHIPGPSLLVKLNERLRIPSRCLPQMTNILVAEDRGVAIMLDVILVIRIALPVHTTRIPVPLLRHTLRIPMSPDSKLRIPKPLGTLVRLQGFPIRHKRSAWNRAFKKT